MIPTILRLQVDDESSAALKKRAAAIDKAIDKLTADSQQLNADRAAFESRPLENLAFGESEEFRDREAALLIKGLGICREIAQMDADHSSELGTTYNRVSAQLDACRQRVHDGLVKFGYRPRANDTLDPSRVTNQMIESHLEVTRLRGRADSLLGRINDHSFRQQNEATLKAIESRLTAMRERLSAI